MTMEPFETYEHDGVPVEIHYDTDPMSPREWDNASVMVCQAPRYQSPDEPQFPNEWEAFERGDYALLERYLRSACGVVAFDQWSSARDCWGYAYVTRERADELGVTDPAAALQAETDEYRSWAQGEAFGFIVDKDGPDEDSCWGFIGDPDYCIGEANSVAAWVAAQRRQRAARRGRPLHKSTLAAA